MAPLVRPPVLATLTVLALALAAQAAAGASPKVTAYLNEDAREAIFVVEVPGYTVSGQYFMTDPSGTTLWLVLELAEGGGVSDSFSLSFRGRTLVGVKLVFPDGSSYEALVRPDVREDTYIAYYKYLFALAMLLPLAALAAARLASAPRGPEEEHGAAAGG